jgi:hypothetical protein
MLLWVLIGIILVAVVIALVSAYGGKTAPTIDPYATQAPDPMPAFEEPEPPKASNWQEGAKTTVSKNFGKGGMPSGVSMDKGGVATANLDEDMERLKNARPFEPRATKLNLDEDLEEVGNNA